MRDGGGGDEERKKEVGEESLGLMEERLKAKEKRKGRSL